MLLTFNLLRIIYFLFINLHNLIKMLEYKLLINISNKKKSLMKSILKLLIIMLFTAAPAFAAKDYLEDIRVVKYWDEPQNITVWVQPSKYSKLAYDSFRAWMKAADGCIRFVDAKSEQSANIQVYFSDSPRIKGSLNAVGVTSYGKKSQRIIIATRLTTRMQIESVLLHEIGHALGINGHSRDITSIMYPNTGTAAGRRLTNKDAATIQKMYCGR